MGKYSAVTAELITRLSYHVAQAGRLLYGYKLSTDTQKDIEGQSDLPMIRLEPPAVSEIYRGTLGHPAMTIEVTVSVERAKGMTELMQKVEAVMDAIETNTAGKLDPGLAGSLTKPVEMSTSTPTDSTLALTAVITISATPRPFVRGDRKT